MMVHWLSKHTNLTGVVWTTSADWARSFSGRVRFAKKRVNRFGVLKTIDEAFYYLVSKNVLKDAGENYQNRLVGAYVREHGQPHWDGESIRTDDINSEEVSRFVRERTADLIMSMCINEFFRRDLRESTRLGAFLWHEGLVPEYKGLYSPFWTMYNRQPEMLGYTVLRMNERYDEGEVYLQGRVTDVNPQTDSPLYIGHKAILDSLPRVAGMLEDLERGTAKTTSVEGRMTGYYTYPGFTHWLRLRARLRSFQPQNVAEAGGRSSVASERSSV
jgi:hypothetical protein